MLFIITTAFETMMNFHIKHSFKILQLMILIFSNLKTNLRWLSFKADENGRVKISSIGENFLHKSNENTCKAVKINFFTTLEINQNFQQSWDYYSKIGLNLGKKKKKNNFGEF